MIAVFRDVVSSWQRGQWMDGWRRWRRDGGSGGREGGVGGFLPSAPLGSGSGESSAA